MRSASAVLSKLKPRVDGPEGTSSSDVMVDMAQSYVVVVEDQVLILDV